MTEEVPKDFGTRCQYQKPAKDDLDILCHFSWIDKENVMCENDMPDRRCIYLIKERLCPRGFIAPSQVYRT